MVDPHEFEQGCSSTAGYIGLLIVAFLCAASTIGGLISFFDWVLQ